MGLLRNAIQAAMGIVEHIVSAILLPDDLHFLGCTCETSVSAP